MIGRTISHYKILEKLGEGGMGVVYKAEDTSLKRPVALKFLAPELTRDAEAKARFVREAQAASSLSHPHIATIHEIGEAEGQSFIAMECVEGESLRQRIAKGPRPIEEAVSIVLEIAEGLREAHEKGIVHRDVKPENVMLTPKGSVKIMDFGLARSAGRTTLTKEGTTLGTVAYMSPEQARGEDVDFRTDLWSWGVILYELLTGRPPFLGDQEAAVLYSVVNEDPPSVTSLRTGIPPELERITAKALAKNRKRRYPSAADILVDLKNLRDGPEATGLSVATKRPVRRKLLLPLAILAAAVLAILLVQTRWTERRPPPRAAENTLAILYFDNLADPEDPERLGEIATNLLITDLSESPQVHVISSQRLYDILKLLGREGLKRVDRETASMVAGEAQARWMLLGSILQVDPHLVVTAQLVEVESGKVVASQRVAGEPEETMFPIVDRLTVELREDLSMPEEGGTGWDRPVAEATTSSPEAYRAYLEGEEYLNRLYWDESRESFEKAVELDSTFAMAYFRLALHAYYNDLPGQKEILAKAIRYSDGVADRERRHIMAQEAILSGGYDEGIARLKEITRIYPDDKTAWFRLGIIHGNTLGRHEEALPYFERAVEIDPLLKMGYNLLAYSYHAVGERERSLRALDRYISLAPGEANPLDTRGDLLAYDGKLDEAIESYRQAEAIKPGFSTNKLGCMHLLQGEYEEAARYFRTKLSSADTETRSWARMRLALIPLHQGKLQEALALLEQGLVADRLEEAGVGPTAKHLLKAMVYEERGDRERALLELDAIAPSPHFDAGDGFFGEPEYRVRLLAEMGRLAEAGVLAEALRTRVDPAEMFRYWWAAGSLEAARGNADSAAVLFRKATSPGPGRFYSDYSLARASLEAGNLSEAVSVLEALLEAHTHSRAFFSVWSVKAHYLLGMAYERSGWTDKAAEEYSDFLEIWRNADPDIPEVEDARLRLGRLTG